MSEMTKSETYALLRRRERLGVRQAARKAGFEHEAPPPSARRLDEAAEIVELSGYDLSSLRKRKQKLEEELEKLKWMERAAELLSG